AEEIAANMNIPVEFVKTYVEDFTDEETGETVQLDRYNIDYTMNSSKLVPTLLDRVAELLDRVNASENKNCDIEIIFDHEDIAKSNIKCEDATVDPELSHRFILTIVNEESRRDEVLEVLKERFPEQKWSKQNIDGVSAILNY
ncbi:MAG: hypothetical protein MJZ12_10235, partial [Prevotella sp.]|nr:hypothetical protein [Prevotella sp.]